MRRTVLAAFVILSLAAGCSSASPSDGASSVTQHRRAEPAPAIEPSPPSTVATSADVQISQPGQPTSGPGGSALAHGDWRVSAGGDGAGAWYAFEPISPEPRKAPVAVIMHGYFEFSGYESMHELIRHTVRTGTIVVYPRWQTDVADPCPGPFDIEPCVQSSVDGILGALSHLESDDSRVQPDLEQVSYFGFSFGAILAANLASRHEALGLPTPRAVFLDDPADSGLAGPGEPALDDSLAGIPPETLFVCHSSAEGAYSREEGDPAQRSCNAVFARIDHVPSANKSLVMTSTDRHGVPALEARHGVCAAPRGQADAYDWNFCWTTWDALRSASVDGPDRRYALGNTPEQRDLGSWSDGTAITPLKVQDEGPILP